jgi:hypothetical protein
MRIVDLLRKVLHVKQAADAPPAPTVTRPPAGPRSVSVIPRELPGKEAVDPEAPDRIRPLVKQPTGGYLHAGIGRKPMEKGRVAEIREEMVSRLGEEGVARLEEMIGAPRSLEIICPNCSLSQIVKPPVADDMRLKVIDLLAKYGVGAKKDDQEGSRYILVMDL